MYVTPLPSSRSSRKDWRELLEVFMLDGEPNAGEWLMLGAERWGVI
jgi:hypothetical protein